MSFTYRMIDRPILGSPWPDRMDLGFDNPAAQLVRRLQNRIRYRGRKGRRAARRLAAIRDTLVGA